MIRCILLLALTFLLGCQSPSPQSESETSSNTGIDSTKVLVSEAIDIDNIHGQLVLMPDSFYLDHPNIPDSAKLLYSRSIIPMDDYYTFAIFDSLETANDTMLPFYFYTTIIISEQSDGALSEMVASTMYSYALNNPQTLQKLLALPDVIKGQTNRDIWLAWTLSEISLDGDGDELEGIELFGELMIRNGTDSSTVAFTSQYIQNLKKLSLKSNQP